MNIAPSHLTHPKRFELKEAPEETSSDPDRAYAEDLNQKILGTQKGLVEGALAGTVAQDQFVRTAVELERLELQHAQARPDGFSGNEKEALERTLREAGMEKGAQGAGEDYRSLYQDLLWGEVSKDDATEELSWRSLRAYGEQLSRREGVVFDEERYKMRAFLFDGHDADQKKPNYDGPYDDRLPALINKAIDLFPRLDTNGDDVVDRTEARHLLTSYQELDLSPAEAATLYSRQKTLAGAVDPDDSGENLTLEDLRAVLPENRPQEMDEDFKKVLSLTSRRLAAQLKSQTPEVQPFALGGRPNPLKVKQGREGSCWVLCNLPPLTDEQLNRLVSPEGDGYRMTLPDGRTTFIEELNEAERRIYSRGDGAWSGLVEKGLSQILEEEGKDINGGWAMKGRTLLSGQESHRLYIDRPNSDGPDMRDPEVMLDTLKNSLSGGAVLAAAYKDGHEEGISKISASSHAYTVVGMDDQTREVTVRNPWGGGENADRDGEDDGVFRLTGDEFFANFDYIYVDKAAS